MAVANILTYLQIINFPFSHITIKYLYISKRYLNALSFTIIWKAEISFAEILKSEEHCII